MIVRNIAILVGAAWILLQTAACHTRSTERIQLLKAESIMEESPDSAYAIVSAIDTTQLSTEWDRALYALLLTQALEKTYHDVDSDTLIRRAVEFYYDSGDDSRLMKSLYYRARTQFFAKQYTKAIEYGLESVELAEKLHDYYFAGKGYDLLSDTYLRTLIIPLQKKYSTLAAENHLKAGKILNHRYSLIDKGFAYLNNRENEEGKRILDSLMTLTDVPPRYRHRCRTGLLIALLRMGKYDEAQAMSDSLTKYKELGLSLYDICNQIYLLELAGKEDEALAQVDSLMAFHKEHSNLVHLAARLNARKGDYKKAYGYLTSIYNAIDSTVTAMIKQSTINAESDFHNARANHYHRQARISTVIIWCIVSGVAVIGVALLLVYREKRKRTRIEIELKMREIRELTDTIGKLMSLDMEKDERMHSLSTRLDSAFVDRLDRMNRLCESYFADENSNTTNSRIYNEMKALIADFTSDEIRKELFRSVNIRYGDVLTRLAEHMPQFTESDRLLLAYVFAGFSPKAISILLNMRLGTVYTKRLRLRERIERTEMPDKQSILALFK